MTVRHALVITLEISQQLREEKHVAISIKIIKKFIKTINKSYCYAISDRSGHERTSFERTLASYNHIYSLTPQVIWNLSNISIGKYYKLQMK